jgi:uncharacterized protein YuzB (UPF0349 family)
MTVDEILAKFEQEQKELDIEEEKVLWHCEHCDKEVFIGDEVGVIHKGDASLNVCISCYKNHNNAPVRRFATTEAYTVADMERFHNAITRYSGTWNTTIKW